MGNNITTDDKTYTTSVGKEIPLEKYTPEFMEHLENAINIWLEGFAENPIDDMTDEEVDYVLNHLENTVGDSSIEDGQLTRMENGEHFLNSGVKEGDILEGNDLFRSFSRTREATDHVFNVKGQYYTDVVFYRTNGNVPFFDPTKFSNPYPHQEEVFVPLDKCKVDKITQITGSDELYSDLLKRMEYDEYEDYVPRDFNSVTLVDISYVG